MDLQVIAGESSGSNDSVSKHTREQKEEEDDEDVSVNITDCWLSSAQPWNQWPGDLLQAHIEGFNSSVKSPSHVWELPLSNQEQKKSVHLEDKHLFNIKDGIQVL